MVETCRASNRENYKQGRGSADRQVTNTPKALNDSVMVFLKNCFIISFNRSVVYRQIDVLSDESKYIKLTMVCVIVVYVFFIVVCLFICVFFLTSLSDVRLCW